MTRRGRQGLILVALALPVALAGVAWVMRPQSSSAGYPIVMLGDSLTEQGDWMRRFAPRDVRNRGVGGEGAGDVRRRLDRIIQERPAAVFLMIGVNDLKTGTPPDTVMREIQEIAMQLRSAGVPIVFQSTVFVDPARRPDINGTIRALNVEIRHLARTMRAPFFDLNRALAPSGRLSDTMTTDGLHLTRSGYAAWAQAIGACIEAIASDRRLDGCGVSPDN